jgi:hypothetical protein
VRRRHLPAPLLLQLVRDVVDVAAEFPVEVIAELIGVPKEDRHKIFHWTNQVLGAADGDREYFISEDQVARAQMEMSFTFGSSASNGGRSLETTSLRAPAGARGLGRSYRSSASRPVDASTTGFTGTGLP